MNPTGPWMESLGLLAAETAIVVGAATLAQLVARSPAWRRTLWQCCVLGLLALTIFEFTGLARSVVSWTAGNSRTPEITPANLPAAPLQLSEAFRRQVAERAGHAAAPAAPAAPPLAGPVANRGVTEQTSLAFWLQLAWLVGAGLVLAWACGIRLLVALLGWKQPPVRDEQLRRRVADLAGELGLRRSVRLVSSARLHVPVAFGLARPTIGLPADFTGRFSPAQQDAMLAHELAHLAARDPAWLLLADAAAALLWWHPLSWWMRRQLRAALETAADEASLLVANGPGVLAECLVELGARLRQQRSFGSIGVAGFRSALGRRVEQLLKLHGRAWSPPSRLRSACAKLMGPIALVTVALICTAWMTPATLTKGESPMKTTLQLTWKRSLAGLGLAAALTWNTAPALAQPAATPPPASRPAAERPAGGALRPAATPRGTPALPPPTRGREVIQLKLQDIIIAQVPPYDGIPLAEVIRSLHDEAQKWDSTKRGINFILNPNPGPQPPPSVVDPATGLPMPPPEAIDVGSITIRWTLPLKDVRMIDVLDLIKKVAEKPITYTIEDYGVVFSLESARRAMGPMVSRTFVVGQPELFFKGMEAAFGIKAPGITGSLSRDIQQRLFSELLTQLGVNLEPPKSIFFNELTGKVMVYVAEDEYPVVRAAIETLGGTETAMSGYSARGGGYGGDPGTPKGSPEKSK